MQFNTRKLISHGLVAGSLLITSSLCFADMQDLIPSNGSGGNGGLGKVQIIGGYSSKYWTASSDSKHANYYLITPSPSFDDTAIVKSFYNQYNVIISDPAKNLGSVNTATTVMNSLTASATSNQSLFEQAMAQYFPFSSDSKNTYSFNAKASGGNLFEVGNQDQSNVAALSFDTMLQPTQYNESYFKSSNSNNPPLDYLKYVTNYYSPTPKIDFSALTTSGGKNSQLNQAFQQSNVLEYLYKIRRLEAVSSVGISNLYYLYSERVPQKTKDLLKNIPDEDLKNLPSNLQKYASPLALQKWIATHRLSSESSGSNGSDSSVTPWVQSIENATPATLQREMVYLLAEIQQQLFKQRMINERILATLSVQQLQSSSAMNFELSQLQSSICNTKLFQNSSACPAASTTTSTSSITGSTSTDTSSDSSS